MKTPSMRRLRVVAIPLTTLACFAATHAAQRDLHGRAAHFAAPAAAESAGKPGDHVLRGDPCPANWAALGPFGGDVQDVAVSPTNPQIVLAGVAPAGSVGGTLYRSTNGGDSWTEVPTVAGLSVYDIEFTTAGVAYIGTIDGVRRSTDNGATFANQPLGIGLNDQVFEVTIDPNNEQVIYAGIADALGSQPVNIMRTVNGGTTWTNFTPPLASPMGGMAVAVKPGDPQTVYAGFAGGFGGGQVWVTTNGGANWTNRSAGLPNTPVRDLAHDGARLLVCGGQLFGGQNFGLYESLNDGQDWTALHDGLWPSLAIHDIEVNPANAQDILVAGTAGIFRSSNGGADWSFGVGGTGSLSANSVSLAPANPSTIFVGASSFAIARSTDGGATFPQAAVGIGRLDVYGVAANPLNPDELAIAFQGLNDGGVFTSVNGGASWTLAPGLPGTRYNNVRFSPTGVLYALSDGPSSIAPEGVYRREVGGNWSSIGPNQGPLFESELVHIVFSDSNPDLIVTCGSDFGVAGAEPTIWVSDDGGDTWDKNYEGPSPNEDVVDLVILPDGTDQTMVASFIDFGSTPQTGGALRSIDGGLSWNPSSTGLSATAQGYGIAVRDSAPNRVYFADGQLGATPGQVNVSTDGGQSWTPVGPNIGPRDIALDPYNDEIVYVMTFAAPRVRISADDAATFGPFDTGLAAAGTGRALFLSDEDGGSTLYYATSTGTYATTGCGVGQACPEPGCEQGDVSGDCVVDLADLATLLANFGSSGATREQGDLNGDGTVNLTDLALLLSVFGADCSG